MNISHIDIWFGNFVVDVHLQGQKMRIKEEENQVDWRVHFRHFLVVKFCHDAIVIHHNSLVVSEQVVIILLKKKVPTVTV